MAKSIDKEQAASEPEISNDKEEKGQKVRFGIRLKFSLAIITLVAVIIVIITGYFVWRETDLLRTQIFQFVARELVHLNKTAQGSIGVEEIALIGAINDLENIKFLRYAYVLNSDGRIIQAFDERSKIQPGEKLNDGVNRKGGKKPEGEEYVRVEYPDPLDKNGTIYDFSRPVLNPLDNKVIGTTIIGLSDSVIRKEVANVVKIILLISLGILGLSIIGSVILTSVIIKPIKVLSRGAVIIGEGNLDHKIEIKSSDELGRLATEFNTMTSMIKEAKDKEIESRIMEEQLEMAKDIQEGLNPMGYYDKAGIQIKGFTRAAKGVGGDYFDYTDMDEFRVCALISDVSGKGVPASLVMVMIRTVFTTYISRGDVDCARVTRAINDSLSADFAIDKFATLFFMIYDRKTEELSFSNAGHGPLTCYRASRGLCSLTKLEGVPIGIMDDVDYTQAKVKLYPGDLVILYTDGVTEMRNPEKEEYGFDRVQQFMMEHNTLNAKDFVEKLVEEVDIFRGEAPPHDDETVLVFKRDS